MRRQLFGIVLIGALGVAISNGTAAAPGDLAQVRDVRIWRQPTHTRVIVELSNAAAYRAQVLMQPARVFIDLEQADVGGVVDRFEGSAEASVRAVWLLQRTPTRARLRIDLDASSRAFRVFHLERPYRVVFDVFEQPPSPAVSEADDPLDLEARIEAATRAEGEALRVAIPVPKPRRRLGSGQWIEPGEGGAPEPSIAIPPPKPQRRRGAAPRIEVPRSKPWRARSADRSIGPASAADRSRAGSPLGFDLRPVRRVVLDPGHGGHDPGAVAEAGLLEKDVTLRVAERVRERLEVAGFDVRSTRDDDRYLDLEQRTEFANRVEADLFVSIHVNAAPNRDTHGVETYFLDVGADAQAARVAARENGTSVAELSALERILVSLRLGYTERFAARLAGSVHTSLVGALRARHPETGDLGTKRGPFLVLFNAQMPAILVEIGFLTNRTEARRIESDAFIEAAAEGIADGISSYAERHDASLVAER